MKHQLTKVLPQPGRFGSALAGIVLLVIAASSSPGQVLPPSSLPYGYSYQEWSAKWWQFSLGQSTRDVDDVGYPGICEGPASRVRFLPTGAPVSGGVAASTNHATIFCDTPLFVPVLDIWGDNTACPTNAFTSYTAEQLAATEMATWNLVTKTTCTIDGVAVAGLDNPTNTIYLTVSPPFSYTTAEKDNVLAGFFGEPCIPGGLTVYPAVAVGVYLMVEPLPPGKHSIHCVGVVGPVNAPYSVLDVTYDITVIRDQDRRDHR